ncbi:endonuclease-reverse transcriptase [Elysia marginata]|uniref:Endonuclease-reverse transcriptase n=1 Tax=Elysia marginata TaxID=1093978 RepID=A0AAV4JKK8_9GAST|nr:endonuclease-reverse transcriptase [Elysia marginata]
MEKRRLATPNKVRHKEINKEIKRKCDQAKEKWLNEQCEEIEKELYKEPKAMYKRIQEITGRKASSKSGCIKSKDGSIIMEKDKKVERWSEYISELFDDDRNEDLSLQGIPEGPKRRSRKYNQEHENRESNWSRYDINRNDAGSRRYRTRHHNQNA